jgi:2-phospho-L-lactate guanylyltransferase
MKPLAQAKSRLSANLDERQREALGANLLRRVLRALIGPAPGLSEHGVLDEVWVVGGDKQVERIASEERAQWHPDEWNGVNETLDGSFDRILGSGHAAMFVPGDLPFLKPRDVHGFVAASGRLKNVTLAPSRQGGGTNGILLVPGLSSAFGAQLGVDSFNRHLTQASSSGISVAIYYSMGLALDLDTFDDLRAYEYMEPGLIEKLTDGMYRPGASAR